MPKDHAKRLFNKMLNSSSLQSATIPLCTVGTQLATAEFLLINRSGCWGAARLSTCPLPKRSQSFQGYQSLQAAPSHWGQRQSQSLRGCTFSLGQRQSQSLQAAPSHWGRGRASPSRLHLLTGAAHVHWQGAGSAASVAPLGHLCGVIPAPQQSHAICWALFLNCVSSHPFLLLNPHSVTRCVIKSPPS